MTSCLLVKAPDRLVAVADGRLSINATTVSFDSTLKIQRVTPKYLIPIISLGRFDHYRDWVGEDCFIAYAGTYALASEVLQEFTRRVSGRLILVWRERRAELSETFDTSAQFLDDYLFHESDYAEFGPREMLDHFRSALQTKGDEWCANRRIPADVEFLIFGKDAQRRYWAYRVSVDSGWSAGSQIRINHEPVKDGILAAIGSPTVSAAAFDDTELQRGLLAWNEDQTAISLTKTLDAFRATDPEQARTSATDTSHPDQQTNWPGREVARRFADLVSAGSDASVGGELTVAIGGWYGEINVRRGL